MKRIYWLLLIVAALAAAGCSPQRDGARSDYDQANQQIEQGQFNSAIDLMTDHLRSNPHDDRARVILASAYAARAGIYLRDYLNFADGVLLSGGSAGFSSDGDTDEFYDQLRRSMKFENGKKIVTAVQQIENSLKLVGEFLVKFQEIPTLDTAGKFHDVDQAVKILDQDQDLNGGPALYRGLLRLVTIRYRVQHFQDVRGLKDCGSDWSVVQEWVVFFHDQLGFILNDFAHGLRTDAQKHGVTHLRQELDKSFAHLESQLPPSGVSCP